MLFEVFTDGSSYINGETKCSSSAFSIYLRDTHLLDGGKFFNPGTNNLGESSAILLALNQLTKSIKKVDKKLLPKIIPITIYTDSMITRDACKTWIYGWIKKAKKDGILYNSEGKQIANQEIFKEIYYEYLLNDKYKIDFVHINSHIIETKMYTNKMDELINYYHKRHKDKDLDIEIPEKFFTYSKFKQAKEKFIKVNSYAINDYDFLRLLVYNRLVDQSASKILSKGLGKVL